MPETYAAYPTASEVLALIAAAGYTMPSGLNATAMEPFVFAAIREWEDGTQYRPFLADADDDEEFFYDPPGPNIDGFHRGGRSLLFLDRGFVSVGEVRSGITPDDATGALLVEGEDYRLLPVNAAYDGLPVTMIEFLVRRWGHPSSIKVTGRPGYSILLHAEVWNAIRQLAAARALEAVRDGLFGTPVEWKEGDISERSSIENIAKLGTGYAAAAERVMLRYRRVTY